MHNGRRDAFLKHCCAGLLNCLDRTLPRHRLQPQIVAEQRRHLLLPGPHLREEILAEREDDSIALGKEIQPGPLRLRCLIAQIYWDSVFNQVTQAVQNLLDPFGASAAGKNLLKLVKNQNWREREVICRPDLEILSV